VGIGWRSRPANGCGYRRVVNDTTPPPVAAPGGDPDRDAFERTVVAALESIVLDRGPRTVDELAGELQAAEPALADRLAGERAGDLVAALTAVARRADELWRLPDGRLAPVLHHLRRAVFTHRVTASELDRRALDLCPDLVALALPRDVQVAGGIALRTAGSADDRRAADEGSLLGPDGWPASLGVAAGSLVALRFDGSVLSIEPVDEQALDAVAASVVAGGLREAFAALPPGRAPEAHRLVIDTMGEDPNAFAVPVAPVGELLATVGLQVRQAWVGPAGESWATPAEDARRRRLEERLTGADGCCRRAAHRAFEAWLPAASCRDDVTGGNLTGPDGTGLDRDAARRLAEDIDHGPVAALLAESATLGPPLVGLRRLGAWAGAVGAAAGATSAGVAYLQALGADADGDPVAAEAHLAAGLAADPAHPACLGLSAELAEDRGDAAASLALQRRTGREPGPDALRDLAPFLAPRDVGRNEPCPCGSGRKYKACCSGRTLRVPLVERCRWLLTRAARHAVRTNPSAVESLRQLFDSSFGGDAAALTGDMLLFPGGGLARYLECRAALLAADERETVASWPSAPMRVLSVEGPGPDGTIRTVDVSADPAGPAGATTVLVDDRAAAAGLQAGETVLTRTLPVGDVHLLTSAVIRIPASSVQRARDLVHEEVRPFSLLALLVDLQVDAIRG